MAAAATTSQAARARDTWTVRRTRQRYAVVSCHVERLLDDRVWTRYRRLLARRPGGFPIASLLRLPDAAFGEAEEPWLARAREAARLGPVGHHAHWTAPDHARPTGGEPGERVAREGAWLRERHLPASLFCGGGWYTDEAVAEACAALGYVDCTPRSRQPAYLDDSSRWAELSAPARVRLPSGSELVALPTTHSLGSLARALASVRDPVEEVVHVYFHDTELLQPSRRFALAAALRLLRLRRLPAEPELLARGIPSSAVAWGRVARPNDLKGTGSVGT
jgi:hypothetical protein